MPRTTQHTSTIIYCAFGWWPYSQACRQQDTGRTRGAGTKRLSTAPAFGYGNTNITRGHGRRDERRGERSTKYGGARGWGRGTDKEFRCVQLLLKVLEGAGFAFIVSTGATTYLTRSAAIASCVLLVGGNRTSMYLHEIIYCSYLHCGSIGFSALLYGLKLLLLLLIQQANQSGSPGGLVVTFEMLLALVLEFDSQRGEHLNLFAKMQKTKRTN